MVRLGKAEHHLLHVHLPRLTDPLRPFKFRPRGTLSLSSSNLRFLIAVARSEPDCWIGNRVKAIALLSVLDTDWATSNASSMSIGPDVARSGEKWTAELREAGQSDASMSKMVSLASWQKPLSVAKSPAPTRFAPSVPEQIRVSLLQRQLDAPVVLVQVALHPLFRAGEPGLHVLHVQRSLTERFNSKPSRATTLPGDFPIHSPLLEVLLQLHLRLLQ